MSNSKNRPLTEGSLVERLKCQGVSLLQLTAVFSGPLCSGGFRHGACTNNRGTYLRAWKKPCVALKDSLVPSASQATRSPREGASKARTGRVECFFWTLSTHAQAVADRTGYPEHRKSLCDSTHENPQGPKKPSPTTPPTKFLRGKVHPHNSCAVRLPWSCWTRAPACACLAAAVRSA